MAVLIWDDDMIVKAMLSYKRQTGHWPKSRDWWYANKGKWPSFTTVCNTKLKWTGLLKIAKEVDRNGSGE